VSDQIELREKRRAARLSGWRAGTMEARRAGVRQQPESRPDGLRPTSPELDRAITSALELLRSVPFEELQLRGWHFQPNDYLTPLNDLAFLRAHPELWTRCKLPAEIEWNLGTQLELLQRIGGFVGELSDVPAGPPTRPGELAWGGGAFPRGDAYAYYGIVRELQPDRVVEIGPGRSSLVLARALAANENGCDVTLVDPFPRWDVLGPLPVGWKMIEAPVQLVDLVQFEALVRGDVLFYDGSHCVRTGGDVNWLFFEVLPRLASGVWIHVHDLTWPWDYVPEWVLDDGLSWNEQYFVQAFLTGNSRYAVRFATAMLETLHRSEVVRFLGDRSAGGSLWIEKLAEPSSPGRP
jgi:hypothetical protein